MTKTQTDAVAAVFHLAYREAEADFVAYVTDQPIHERIYTIASNMADHLFTLDNTFDRADFLRRVTAG